MQSAIVDDAGGRKMNFCSCFWTRVFYLFQPLARTTTRPMMMKMMISLLTESESEEHDRGRSYDAGGLDFAWRGMEGKGCNRVEGLKGGICLDLG